MKAPRLALRDVSVRLGGRIVAERISLDLAAGALVALVGPNGAGKTSLLRAVVGLVKARGTIAIDGTPIAALSGRERARRIAYLPQGHEAHWPLPVRDIVALGRLPHGAGDPDRLTEADREAVAQAMALTDVAALADRSVSALSGGERARVALARVFATRAAIILADEPTAALDPRHQIDVLRSLRRAADEGALVVAVTHDLGLAARFADRLVVLAEGRLAAQGVPDIALTPDVLSSVFGVEAYFAVHRGKPVIVPWA